MDETTTELANRLKRLYAAMGAVYKSDEIAHHINATVIAAENNEYKIHLDFSQGRANEDIHNSAWTAIHNAALLHTYALEWAKANGVSTEEVNAVSEGSLALKIVRDLDNKDKHPAAPINRSVVSPQLDGLEAALRIPPNKGLTLRINLKIGATGEFKVDEGLLLIIKGSIINGRTGEKVYAFPDLLLDGIAAWEAFLRERGIQVG